MRVVALLRGVNVGGVRIRMADLASALERSGFTEVRTVLATGNVLVTSSLPTTQDVGAVVAGTIREVFGFDLAVIAVDLPTVWAAIDGYPFAPADGRHAYVVFAEDPAVLRELVDGAGPLDPDIDRIAVGDGVLYWQVPKGSTLDSPFGKHLGKRQRSGAVTTRNRNTLEKIAAAG